MSRLVFWARGEPFVNEKNAMKRMRDNIVSVVTWAFSLPISNRSVAWCDKSGLASPLPHCYVPVGSVAKRFPKVVGQASRTVFTILVGCSDGVKRGYQMVPARPAAGAGDGDRGDGIGAIDPAQRDRVRIGSARPSRVGGHAVAGEAFSAVESVALCLPVQPENGLLRAAQTRCGADDSATPNRSRCNRSVSIDVSCSIVDVVIPNSQWQPSEGTKSLEGGPGNATCARDDGRFIDAVSHVAAHVRDADFERHERHPIGLQTPWSPVDQNDDGISRMSKRGPGIVPGSAVRDSIGSGEAKSTIGVIQPLPLPGRGLIFGARRSKQKTRKGRFAMKAPLLRFVRVFWGFSDWPKSCLGGNSRLFDFGPLRLQIERESI